ncbi:MAG: oligosaccharide flippase family protein [Mycobacteriaceae bacterium]
MRGPDLSEVGGEKLAVDNSTTKTGILSLVRSGGVLAAATLIANAGNYALNLVLGRWLTPAEFSDATLMITLMFTVTSVSLCLQLVAARAVGASGSKAQTAIKMLTRRAWIAGVIVALVLGIGAPLWHSVFHTESVIPLVVLAVGMPWYLVQSVGRGVLQGDLRFGRLAASLLVEMGVRLVVSIVLVVAGLGVTGATIGLAASFFATWLVVRGVNAYSVVPGVLADSGSGPYAAAIAVLVVGQIVIMNGDVLIAKAFLNPDDAGVYSVIALVGRAVFFVSWSATMVIFPAAARRHAQHQETRSLLITGAGVVAGLGAGCTVGAYIYGDEIVRIMLGGKYFGLSHQLGEYALATTLFAVANLIASYHLSTHRLLESRVLLFGAFVQTAILLLWHSSTVQLVHAQLVSMGMLLLAIFFCQWVSGQDRKSTVRSSEGVIA